MAERVAQLLEVVEDDDDVGRNAVAACELPLALQRIDRRRDAEAANTVAATHLEWDTDVACDLRARGEGERSRLA